MWICPKCARPFTRPNQTHSCGQFSVEAFLRGRSNLEVALYRRFEALALEERGVTLAPAKTRVGFQRGRIFAAVNGIGPNGMRAHIVTRLPIRGPRIVRTEVLSPGTCINHVRFTKSEEIDSEVAAWLRAGREWGAADERSR